MDLELFTISLKENGVINVEINEDIMNAYNMTLEEIEDKFDTDSLTKSIEDFIRCLNS